MKRIAISLMSILLALLILVSCGGNTQGDAKSTSDTTSTYGQIELVKDGVANYVVVRPDKASQTVIDAAITVRKAISKATNTEVMLETDWLKSGTTHDPSKKVILVGLTNYEESLAALNEISYSEYLIKVAGDKLIIGGYGDDSVKKAADLFESRISTYVVKDGNGAASIMLPADTSISGSRYKVLDKVPKYNNGKVDGVYDCGDSCYMLVFGDTTTEDYIRYKNDLSANGFKEYTTNTIGSNLFATYTNDNYTINTYYTDYNNTSRVIIEPKKNLPGLESENVYENKVSTAVTMLGLEYPAADGNITNNGLSMLIRLADGSFVIIDGGFNRDWDANRLYQEMYKQAPDNKNIVIAAWIITHAHADHVGCFKKFTGSYSSKVAVEKFIINFPTETDTVAIKDEGQKGYDSLIQMMNKYKDSKIIKAHAGQLFHLRNAKIEMLYTLEDQRPDEFSYYNMSSLVFSFTAEGQKIMFLGDAYTTTSNILVKKYGNYLASDIVQVAHHGYVGGTEQVYSAIQPKYVLWPISTSEYPVVAARPQNDYLIKLPSVKEIFVAKDLITTLTLPYNK